MADKEHSTKLYRPIISRFNFKLLFAGTTQKKKDLLAKELTKYSRIMLGIAKTSRNSSHRRLYETYFIALAGSVRIIREDWDKTFWTKSRHHRTLHLKPNIRQFAAGINLIQKQMKDELFPESVLPYAQELKEVFLSQGTYTHTQFLRSQVPELETMVNEIVEELDPE